MDFFQDIISTVHDFGDGGRQKMNARLKTFALERKIGLVVPTLLSDSRTDSFNRIMQTLKGAEFLNEVIIPLSAKKESEVQEVRDRLNRLPFRTRVLWCEDPRVTQLVDELAPKGIDISQRTGKGYAVWLGIGVASLNNDVLVFHDADIHDYSLDLPARLAYPLVDKELDFFCSKAYYSRLTDQRFYGRVVRLFVWPFLDSLIKIAGDNSRFLSYLRAFRYPLSGEFALASDLAENVRIPTDWGLEMSLLSEVYRNASIKRLCQVDLGTYSHKHRDVGDDVSEGLLRMVRDIIITTLRSHTETEGFVVTPENLVAMRVMYRRTAQEYVRKYFVDAKVNSMNYDRHIEDATIERFVDVITDAGGDYLRDPARHQIPDWLRVRSARPDTARNIMATTRQFEAFKEDLNNLTPETH